MDWIEKIKRDWSTIVTAVCLIIVGILTAWRQAATDMPANIRIPRLERWWNYVPLALLVIAGLSWFWGKRSRGSLQPRTAQSPTPPPSSNLFPTLSSLLGQKSNVTFDAKEHFRLAYFSPLTAEVEKNIRVVARNYDPNDIESFYARFIGVGLVSVMHNSAWTSIYKSQFLLLTEMNRKGGMAAVQVARSFYDDAAKEYPQIYANYTFDEWVNFLKREQLLIEHPSAMLEITHKAKDFLKYIAHWGGDLSGKKG